MRVALWVQIFVYTIVLLVISQALSFFLHNALVVGDLRLHFVNSIRHVLAELTDQPLRIVQAHARLYNHGQQRIWLTNADGSPLPGQEFSRDVLLRAAADVREESGLTLIESRDQPKFWISAPIRLKEGEYALYMSFGPPPRPIRNGFLIQLFAPVLVVGLTLALWMAWRVSRPLRRLRNEVRVMSETGPECTVTVAGTGEIADVATAVNVMAESLALHMRGMRSLITNISHELRSPLARANLALGILEESLPAEYTSRGAEEGGMDEAETAARKRLSAKYIAALQEELAHMDTLIGTTLLTQKMEVQKDSVHLEPLDFSRLCDNVWKRYKPMFMRNALVPAGAIEPGIVVAGNRTLLVQLLANLLDNCMKYTSQGGEVRFSLRLRSGKCLLQVENSHEPMDESKLDHIFDPFYRIDQAVGTGVGLGLALAQKTVALHRGEIMAVTTEIGLCICLQLPLSNGT